MTDLINILNRAGDGFCGFALAMLIQSGILIVLLYLIDLLIRRHVRAVFRYCIWMLIFAKLILPPTLCLPTGIGYWCSLGVWPANKQVSTETPVKATAREADSIAAQHNSELPPSAPKVSNQLVRTKGPAITDNAAYMPPPILQSELESASVAAANPGIPITWRAVVFLVWLVGILVLSVLLFQRVLFVKSLLAQSDKANGRLDETLQQCCRQVGLRRNIEFRLSRNMLSPAVCGLFNPVILMPASLLENLSREKLRAVLIHELAHIKRGDLWVNFMQTILQIVYFYNPLLWFANAVVRGIREKAVDEMVLTKLGDEADSYSGTLIDIAEIAFSKPHFSLRLVGVVESKSALTSRIKHILSRPFPKSAKLGIAGLIIIFITAVVLLPMAKGQLNKIGLFDRNTLVKFKSKDKPNGTIVRKGNTTIFSKNYDVAFRKGEKLLVFAELYETGKPMRRLGYKIFSGSTKSQKLKAIYTEKSRLIRSENPQYGLNCQLRIELGDEVFTASANVTRPTYGCSGGLSWWHRDKITNSESYVFALLADQAIADTENDEAMKIWVPGSWLVEGEQDQ